MNKSWVLYSTIATYAISLLMFFMFNSGINNKEKDDFGNNDFITINDKKNQNNNYNNNVIDNKPSNIFYFIHVCI